MKQFRRITGIFAAAVLVVSAIMPAHAADAGEEPTAGSSYAEYISRAYSDAAGIQKISLDEARTIEEGGNTELEFSVEAEDDYEFILGFRPVSETAQYAEYGLTVDGISPFDGAEGITAYAYWEDSGSVSELSNGDQIAPPQKQTDGIMYAAAADAKGIELSPYKIHLEAGAHIISVSCIETPFIFYGFFLVPSDPSVTYDEAYGEYEGVKKYEGTPIVIEAEETAFRNSYSLKSKSDNSSSEITPNNPVKSLINYIGGSNWAKPGQEIYWDVEVPEDGLYKLGFMFKQSSVIDGYVYRRLKIDGKSPFSEAEEIGFPYKTSWQFSAFADESGDEYLIYLEKGTHTLSLEVTLAEISEIYNRLNAVVEEIGATYLDIVMITGETPDSNRDYELYKQIPDFNDRLKSYADRLGSLSVDLNSKYTVNGELDGAVKNMARVTENMYENMYSSHLYLKTYYSYYQTLSSWLFDIKNMSLNIDKIILCAPDSEFEEIGSNFFEKIIFSVRRFIASFSGDYTMESLSGGSDTIKIWVNWGRDQVKVLNTLIQEDFSRETGINVKVEQVNASLVQGIISNNSPDLYLQMARTEPVNLAMRGVLYDLKNFDDFEEVLENFQKGAEKPYIYHDGCYALPDTQSFYVMFYREDILEELGIEVPKTWDDFLSATSVMQRKNMNTYLPYVRISASTTVNTGAGGLSIFPTMLLQNNETLYNDELNGTRLASALSVKVFSFWTDFYTKYKLNPDVNFYQRFRVGTVPLGVATYTQYLTFEVAAAEIEGKWGIAALPGFENEDGTINNVSSGAGTGCSIMGTSKNKEAAWEFLKWWVSEDTQYNYSAEIEAILGVSGRIATSNVKALERLSWDRKSLDVIKEQWQKVVELEEVPGSYYVSRSIDQAFWEVYNADSTEKEAITDWAEVSDNEIKRKIAEYSGKNSGGEN